MKFHSKPTYSGVRPLITLNINKRYTSLLGVVISTKMPDNKYTNTLKYPYDSVLERDLFYNLIHDYHCIEFNPQAELTSIKGKLSKNTSIKGKKQNFHFD